MDITQGITLGIALLGAALGVINTWRAFSNDRVRIRIKPTYTIDTGGVERLAVNVVNLSTFPVTITHIGFTQHGTSRRLQLMRPPLFDGGSLPKRLESRTALTAFAAPGATEEPGFSRAKRVYVDTACGLHIAGANSDLARAVHNLSLARRQ